MINISHINELFMYVENPCRLCVSSFQLNIIYQLTEDLNIKLIYSSIAVRPIFNKGLSIDVPV